MMRRPRKLLSVAHSYCVALNRRLANEMAILGAGEWEVTAVAPTSVHGDLRDIELELDPSEACRLEPIAAHFTGRIHVMLYGARLRRLLRAGWDLVHCWEEPYVFSGGQVAVWTPPAVPLVFWTAQNLQKRYPPPFSWIERYCVARAAGWLACGETTQATMLQRPGYGRLPHRVMPLGVDTREFRPDAAAGRGVGAALGWTEAGPPVVGYLGRFVEDKGLRVMMRALDATRTPWRALFVGGGPMEGELREWSASKGDRVRIATGVVHDQVPAYLNAMDLLCAPSQTMPNWREQLGRMVIEAFACGVPVVASDSGELPWVVEDAGRVVGERDAVGWAQAIGDLIESPEMRRDLGARGLERAHSVFAWPRIARSHLDFFSEVLDTRKSAVPAPISASAVG
jgi:glycosyltransferase involved in cell wall biosynthesis